MSDDYDYLAEGRLAFAEEAIELLEQSESILLKLEDEPENHELVNDLFRAVHTIKGSAGIFGFNDVVSFTHVAESVMGMLRGKELSLNEELMSLLLDSRDQMNRLVRQAIDNPDDPLPESVRQISDDLLAQLQQHLDGEVATSPAAAVQSEPVSAKTSDQVQVSNDYWHISIRFDHSVLANGMDPLSFFRYLNTVGDIVS
ncbi:MAG: chemotaxis protein CheA, partial [Gammaproteobacteria bacterium]|nr:chemotaxis protein CheA [Gammaproteobacteria bacterium]